MSVFVLKVLCQGHCRYRPLHMTRDKLLSMTSDPDQTQRPLWSRPIQEKAWKPSYHTTPILAIAHHIYIKGSPWKRTQKDQPPTPLRSHFGRMPSRTQTTDRSAQVTWYISFTAIGQSIGHVIVTTHARPGCVMMYGECRSTLTNETDPNLCLVVGDRKELWAHGVIDERQGM